MKRSKLWDNFAKFRNNNELIISHDPPLFNSETISLSELLECYNNDNTKPKLRQKVKNELIRRKKLGLVNIITRDESGEVSEFK